MSFFSNYFIVQGVGTLKNHPSINPVTLTDPLMALKLLIGFTCLLIFNQSNADVATSLRDMEPSIYTNAQQSLDDLAVLEKDLANAPPDNKIWFHIRKAQAEFLLLLFDPMANSLSKANALLTPDSDEELKVLLLFLKGLHAQSQDSLTIAKVRFVDAQRKAAAANLDRLALHSAAQLAYTYTVQDDHENALFVNNDAHLKALSSGDHFMIAKTNYVYGATFLQLNQFQQSIDYNIKALELFETLGYQHHISEALLGIAAAYRYWGKFDEALNYYSRYLKSLMFIKSEESKYHAYHGIASTLAEMGKCAEALTAIDRALSAKSQQLGWDAELYKKQALCHVELGNTVSADTSFKLAQTLYEILPDLKGTVWEIEMLRVEAEVEKSKGHHKKALALLTGYYEQTIKLEEKNHSGQLLRAREALESQRKDLEIQLLKGQQETQRLLLASEDREGFHKKVIASLSAVALLLIGLLTISGYRNNRRLHAASIADDLSGLYNRRHTFESLEEKIKSGKETSSPLSTLLVDVDDLKVINDLYGFNSGDSVIHSVSKLCADSTREYDILGRTCGGEFLFILPDTSPDDSEKLALQLLDTIKKKIFILPSGKTINITVSMGVCHQKNPVLSAGELYRRADIALALSKAQGKNRLNIAEG